jgi:Fe-S oxidoreductase
MLRAIAGKSALVEAFLDKRWDDHPRRPTLRPREGELLFHGHCHQKALWGAESSTRLLGRVCGDGLRVLKTGCCGMAGSFGFTTDRYDLSMRIGELALLPEIRARPEASVCAPGTSCRHQILDGTGRHALHPVEVLRAAITSRDSER